MTNTVVWLHQIKQMKVQKIHQAKFSHRHLSPTHNPLNTQLGEDSTMKQYWTGESSVDLPIPRLTNLPLRLTLWTMWATSCWPVTTQKCSSSFSTRLHRERSSSTRPQQTWLFVSHQTKEGWHLAWANILTVKPITTRTREQQKVLIRMKGDT